MLSESEISFETYANPGNFNCFHRRISTCIFVFPQMSVKILNHESTNFCLVNNHTFVMSTLQQNNRNKKISGTVLIRLFLRRCVA